MGGAADDRRLISESATPENFATWARRRTGVVCMQGRLTVTVSVATAVASMGTSRGSTPGALVRGSPRCRLLSAVLMRPRTDRFIVFHTVHTISYST